MATIESHQATLLSIDDESLALILDLQQEDGEHFADSAKGKKREGELNDAELALQIYLEEIAGAASFALDRRMTRSIQMAIRDDADALNQVVNAENAAKDDRAMSIALSNGTNLANTNGSTANDLAEDMELIEKMSCIYVTGVHDENSEGESSEGQETNASDHAESSAWAASRPRRSTQKRECVSCGEHWFFTDVARAPCQHEYCRGCLRHLFEDAMVDESLFPPRCCKQPIPLNRNILFLPERVVILFREKSVEFSTPNRTYCHQKTCSAFVPPTGCANGIATCTLCAAQTCTTCKSERHSGDCPHDEALQEVITLAREVGWQRCRNCWTMVELNTGCNHMT
ncbi:hypothetical protein TruAng_008024 [Truncatella angustata]|nr:hypothetical protein TruAng_008024 [Truncatella angustata]